MVNGNYDCGAPDRTDTFTYDWAGRLETESVSENGIATPLVTGYQYNADGTLKQLTYPSGFAVLFDRDPATREVVAVRNVAGGAAFASNITRYPAGPIAGLTYANGRTLAQTFNSRYEPLSVQSGPLRLTYVPTPSGDMGVVTDQSEDPSSCVRNVSRSAKYDFQDRMSAWSDAVQTGAGVCPADAIPRLYAAFTYVNGTDQIASQLASTQDSRPVLAFGYDVQGNISAIGQYDAAGGSIANAVCLRHDALGRMVLAGNTSTTLTPGGTKCSTDAEVSTTLARFKYDARNRRVARQVNDQWTYVVSDGSGNPLSELSLAGGSWTKVRDYVWLDGRLLAQIEYAGSSAYTYFAHVDHLGVPRALTNQNGQLVWSTYQRPFAEVVEKTTADPLSGRTVVTNLRLLQYDERAAREPRAAGAVFQLENRMMAASNSRTGSSVAYSFVYDEAPFVGRLTTVVEPERTVGYGYDAAGNLSTETVLENGVPAPLVTTSVYYADGALWKLTYPSGLQLELVRNAATREVVEIRNVSAGTSFASQIVHFPGGPAKALSFGNGLTMAQALDRRYQPQSISSGPLSLGYQMTPAGDVKEISDTSATLSGCQRNTSWKLGHDFLDRFVGGGWLSSNGCDGDGVPASPPVESSAATFTYTAGTDRVERQWVPSGATQVSKYSFGYDYQGNLTVIGAYDSTGTSFTKGLCLRHDALSRITLVGDLLNGYLNPYYCSNDSYIQSVTARFKYDWRGRRIARRRSDAGPWTYVVSDAAGSPLSELESTGNPAQPWRAVRDYVWLDGKPLAQIEYPGPAGGSQGYVYYHHVDHIGLPRAMTNASGQLVWNTFPKPYGDLAEHTATDPLSGRTVVTNLRLPGQYDERLFGSVGLQGPYYNWNRWYLPGVGRYLELDPVALAGTINGAYAPDWYGYASQNPLTWTDPTGLWPLEGCPGCLDTCCCSEMKNPGSCPGAAIPVQPGKPPPIPEPPPTCPTIEQPPPPPIQPMPPGMGCKAGFDFLKGACAAKWQNPVARGACIAAAAAWWAWCTAHPH